MDNPLFYSQDQYEGMDILYYGRHLLNQNNKIYSIVTKIKTKILVQHGISKLDKGNKKTYLSG